MNTGPKRASARESGGGRQDGAGRGRGEGRSARSRGRALSRGHRHRPDLWEARYNLGVVLASAGDLASAEDELKQAHTLAPEMQDVVVALAEVERRRGEHRKEAAELLGDFVTRTRWPIDARTLLVGALRNSGQVDKAITQGARGARPQAGRRAGARPSSRSATWPRARSDTAQLLAKQALDANPKSAIAHRAMGLIHLGAATTRWRSRSS